MKNIAGELEKILEEHTASVRGLSPEKMRHRPTPGKWSKKEIIGHLVDSSQSNIRRFVMGQYEEAPYIRYNQDKWVSICGYQEWDEQELISLWYFLNKQIIAILKNMDPVMAQRNVQTEALHSIEWLATDYLKHLRHHLHQVLDLEPVAYP